MVQDQILMEINENEIINTKNIISGEQIIYVNIKKIREIVERWISKGIEFHLSSIYVIDEIENFEIFYYFFNRKTNFTIILAEILDRENPQTLSISDLTGSVFYEGEATEMFGISFIGNSITEVFLPENWDSGFPMRKDWTDTNEGGTTS